MVCQLGTLFDHISGEDVSGNPGSALVVKGCKGIRKQHSLQEVVMEPILVVFIIFGSVGAVIWKFLDGRHGERMAMIDKGTKAADLKGSFPRFRLSPLSNLKWGLFLAAIGLGVAFASYMENMYDWDGSMYPAMIFLFGGSALVIFYTIAKSKIKEED